MQKSPNNNLREILSRHDFTPKKKLGQHFMIDRASIERIVRAGELSRNDVVLEIGTGTGILTKELSDRAKKVISIEYDKILFEITKDILRNHKNIDLIRDDFLRLDLKAVLRKEKNYKVIANLPYYITAPIITKLLETKPMFSLAVLTVQKEVAERIVAGPGGKDYGPLSIYAQYHLEASIDSLIPKSAFFPHPAVSSAILILKPRKTPPAKVANEDVFFKLFHAAFEHRRKTLRNAILLSHKFVISKEKLDKALSQSGIDGERRGETLSIEEFAKLANELS